ncbi:protein of unknown function [Methanoculleus bourgensis]|uniref:Uncharacterized protein n=1 Tax=Methanoculleus bourgensis TaxID=83986 RepID=A0A0X3BHL2_9EURY|nr:protein of unknown function [Methanoculleus bourgensis]
MNPGHILSADLKFPEPGHRVGYPETNLPIWITTVITTKYDPKRIPRSIYLVVANIRISNKVA